MNHRARSLSSPHKAAGGVLTAKQAPRRPGTAPAPVCAPGRCAAILPQTDREKDVSILPGNGDRTLQPALSQAPLRPALCARRSDDTEVGNPGRRATRRNRQRRQTRIPPGADSVSARGTLRSIYYS